MRFMIVALMTMMMMPWLGSAEGASKSEQEIRRVMRQQEEDWNRGDVEAFMRGYVNSSETLFVGSTITRGWQATLDNYRRRYSSRAQMGQLTFTIQEVRLLGRDHAFVLGAFRLQRDTAAGGEAQGKFTLTWTRTKGGWKILIDHTSN